MESVPNPGSKEAQEMGCLCPVVDNGYGAGYYTTDNGVPVFVVNESCPIHGKKTHKKIAPFPR